MRNGPYWSETWVALRFLDRLQGLFRRAVLRPATKRDHELVEHAGRHVGQDRLRADRRRGQQRLPAGVGQVAEVLHGHAHALGRQPHERRLRDLALHGSVDGKAAQRFKAVHNRDQIARCRRLGRQTEPRQHGEAGVRPGSQQRLDLAAPVRSERTHQDAMNQPLGPATRLVQDQFQHGGGGQQDPPASQLVDQCGCERHRITGSPMERTPLQ